jgi:hypothetical protein
MRPSAANLAALYASLNGRSTTPFKLVTVMTRPVPAARMAGNTALVTRATPKKLSSIACDSSSIVSCSNVPRFRAPALLTSRSIPPGR